MERSEIRGRQVWGARPFRAVRDGDWTKRRIGIACGGAASAAGCASGVCLFRGQAYSTICVHLHRSIRVETRRWNAFASFCQREQIAQQRSTKGPLREGGLCWLMPLYARVELQPGCRALHGTSG
jgi:hypothetical protein